LGANKLCRWHRTLLISTFGQVLPSIDVKPKTMERNCLDPAPLYRGVDVECTRDLDRFVPGIEDRVDLTELHAFDDHLDFNEVPAVSLEVGQAIKAGDVPCRGGICLP